MVAGAALFGGAVADRSGKPDMEDAASPILATFRDWRLGGTALALFLWSDQNRQRLGRGGFDGDNFVFYGACGAIAHADTCEKLRTGVGYFCTSRHGAGGGQCELDHARGIHGGRGWRFAGGYFQRIEQKSSGQRPASTAGDEFCRTVCSIRRDFNRVASHAVESAQSSSVAARLGLDLARSVVGRLHPAAVLPDFEGYALFICIYSQFNHQLRAGIWCFVGSIIFSGR